MGATWRIRLNRLNVHKIKTATMRADVSITVATCERSGQQDLNKESIGVTNGE